ncbi:hypothetical protein HUW51_16990 [Adhaeribacter swui]|uniref:Uncharacterized protein n=1 Tax=Adhaeribacter swui TaxID=2086471 RepID=A0A7G7GB00_9BACT|nr:hypothetical protein [Adhaeribacter swui]QNF34334.1 hypothetical protein HUW51_16990 [Adhaeribacter swui]
MKTKKYYYRQLTSGMKKLFVEMREELAADLKAGTIDQATFDECDKQCEQCLTDVIQEMEASK